ncbi:SDR family oxidoreductase [Streptomyces sp. PG2]
MDTGSWSRDRTPRRSTRPGVSFPRTSSCCGRTRGPWPTPTGSPRRSATASARSPPLFLNAGITRPTPLEKADEETFDEVFEVNAKGQFFTLQKTAPLLADGASVVFTVGIGVTSGIPGGSVTAGSRGALLAMVPSLALELAPRRIRVNAVSPGAVDTPIWTKSGLPAELLAEVKETTATRVPFGRFGTAREIAETVAFLVSDGAAYVTGQNIVVGGGSGLGV